MKHSFDMVHDLVGPPTNVIPDEPDPAPVGLVGSFDPSLPQVLKHEGGFVNHPKDPGGATNLGITIGTAKRLGIDVDGDRDTDVVDIKNLTRADAAKVYRHEYWNKIKGDDLPPGVDYAVFDASVNSGPKRAAKWLQAVVGVIQDGVIGPKTLDAVWQMDPQVVVSAICRRRMAFLRALPIWGTFGRGWQTRVDGVEAFALKMAASGGRRPTEATTPHPVPQPAPVPRSKPAQKPIPVEPAHPQPAPTNVGTGGGIGWLLFVIGGAIAGGVGLLWWFAN